MSATLPEFKEGWMDSIDFEHELGEAPVNEICATEEGCRARHKCIEASEKEPSPHGYDCRAMRVYVIDADEWDKIAFSAKPAASESAPGEEK